VVLRNTAPTTTSSTPWTTLASRRFGGDVSHRLVAFQTDDTLNATITADVRTIDGRNFDVTITSSSGGDPVHFTGVPAELVEKNTLATRLGGKGLKTTIVSQPPPPALPASQSHNSMERIHLFADGHRTSLVLPSPKWLLSLSSEVLNAHKGGLRAPMPSLVVEVRVKPGDKVEKGQAVVVLESMKTETVLRAHEAGVVKSVGCKNGEMVEEGRELVDIEPVESEAKDA
jgi:3-methylcrotonyl-CoA carboxylase alpha subunit